MTRKLKIALLQIAPPHSEQEALDQGKKYCIQAAKKDADIILFPELWNTGYRFPNPAESEDVNVWKANAIARDSHFVQSFQKLAKEVNTAIAITYLEDCGEPKPRNSLTLFDRHGNEQLHYSKVHTCDFGPEILTAPGKEFKVSTLNTAAGDVQIGAMICFDREQPESARLLMLHGAEIIITPNACDLGRAQLQQFSTRAYENMVGVAMTNYPASRFNGHSVAYSPIVVDEKHQDVDNCLVLANEKVGIFYAEFDIEAIRVWRKRQIWGNAFRKPKTYGEITSETIQPQNL